MKAGRRRHLGLSTLLVIVTVLFVAMLVAGYSSFVLSLEHHTLQGLQRATQARQLAQSGLDWGIAMLNTPRRLNGRCLPDANATQTFRDAHALSSATPAQAVCQLADTPDCWCPRLAESASQAPNGPGFAVRFEPEGTDERIRLVSHGCLASQTACPATDGDALAVTVTAEPLLPHPPQAALTCGQTCSVSGALSSVTPTPDTAIAIAGDTVQIDAGATLEGPAGTPAQGGLVSPDSELALRRAGDPDCSQGLVFQTFFGVPPAAYAVASNVRRIDCTEAADCTRRLQEAMAEGWRLFDFPSGLHLEAGSKGLTWGEPQSPVVLVVSGPLEWTGPQTLHGLLFVNRPGSRLDPASPLTVEGAVAACGSVTVGQRVQLRHSPAVTAETRRLSRRYVVRPGSWSDRP